MEKSKKTGNNTKSAFQNAEKAKKKSKHGKKNWRKNIDVADIEKKLNQEAQKEIIDQQVQALKDEDLFVFDVKPVNKKSFLNKKTKRQGKGKLSKNEERVIRRVAEKIRKEEEGEKPDSKKAEAYDLWVDDSKVTKPHISFPKPQLKFPKVPLPHPGQSYNPSREDLTKLLHKVADLHKPIERALTEPTPVPVEENKFLSDDEEEEEFDPKDFNPSNNPAVDDFTQRKTIKEKKKNIQKKLNKEKEKQLAIKKENKIKLAHEKTLKRIEKEREEQSKQEDEKKKLDKLKEKEKEDLLKLGIVEDPYLLADFNVKKNPVPLRKMKANDNIISERFNNILKREVLGEYSNQIARKKNKNRKLNKIQYKNFNNDHDYGYSVENGDKLKIFE